MNEIFTVAWLAAFVPRLHLPVGSGQQNEYRNTESVAEALQVQDDNDGFVQIFDGSSLNGWDGDPTYWRVEDGYLGGRNYWKRPPWDRNHFSHPGKVDSG